MSSHSIHAIYEDGVFKPTEPVELPERCQVIVEPATRETEEARKARVQAEIYEILGERYNSGDPYGAERHNTLF